MTLPFVHLKAHSDYSIIDGIIKVPQLIAAAQHDDQPAVALTDEANLFATVKFISAAHQRGIKPIIGCEFNHFGIATANKLYRVTLLAATNQGFLHLMQLATLIYTDSSATADNYKVLQLRWLEQYGEGLIALSGGQLGECGHYLGNGAIDAAKHCAEFWQRLFPARWYIELQRLGRDREETYISNAVMFAELFQIPVVATNDVRFLAKQDFYSHELRVCVSRRELITDANRDKNYTKQQYFRSQQEMTELFADLPQALANTWAIAQRCSVTKVLRKPTLPRIQLPNGITPKQELATLAKQGLAVHLQRIPTAEHQIYLDRLRYELDIIHRMGFDAYFLIVHRFISTALAKGIPVGLGRGSGTASLVAYSLHITNINPIQYGLLFERFLNIDRANLPDFDIDFCVHRRNEVIEDIFSSYGQSHVAQIITFNAMNAKAVVRDVSRVLGKPYNAGDKIAKEIPATLNITLSAAFAANPALQEIENSDTDAAEILVQARKLEGLIRGIGKHAAGIVIAADDIVNFAPVYAEDNGEQPMVQFDKDDAEKVGLVKFDILGLKTLTILAETCRDILVNHGTKIDLDTLPLNDQPTLTLLSKGDTDGVFQLESPGMRHNLRKVRISRIEDLIALVALFRPGPMDNIPDFIARKRDPSNITYPHADVADILKETYGIAVYQEQVLQIAQKLGGFSLGQADDLRRAMSKKKAGDMDKHRDRFIAGAMKSGLHQQAAIRTFEYLEKFASYGFNKAHAASYAIISYQTAWLKQHYPVEFLSTSMNFEFHSARKVITLIHIARQRNIVVVPPHINQSMFNCTNAKNKIICGLGMIRGVGEVPIAAIVAARKAGAFTSLLDVCSRVTPPNILPKTVLEKLVNAGACDGLAEHRAQLQADIDLSQHSSKQQYENAQLGLADMFGNTLTQSHVLRTTVQPWSTQKTLNNEHEVYGFYLTDHPLGAHAIELKQLHVLNYVELLSLNPNGEKRILPAVVHGIKKFTNQQNKQRIICACDDQSSMFDLSIPTDLYDNSPHAAALQEKKILLFLVSVSTMWKSEDIKIIVEDFFPIDVARRRYCESIQMVLTAETIELLPKIEEILDKYHDPAGHKVLLTLYHNNLQTKIQLANNVSICFDQMFANECKIRLPQVQIKVTYNFFDKA